MKKILITGFEPFGGEEINPSWEGVFRLPDEILGYSIIKERLPVVFGEAAETVIRRAERIEPRVILCVGQAGGRGRVTPELVGINLRHAEIPDNAGNFPKDEPITEGGKAAYFSTLPVRRMVDKLKDVGIPAAVSYSAGAYVCNDLLYSLLQRFENTSTKVGFIHIPYIPEQNKSPSMPLSEIVRALRISLEGCVEDADG